ncbi:MAG: hypothetical protein HOV68_09140 [Streptomycetaceae bacterium]|nr:hypothetical protein [Streptomycetaceae bacterium]
MTASRAALGRDGLRVKVAVQRVRVGTEEYRVISPARPLRNAVLNRAYNDGYDMYVDRTDGRRVGTLLLLAARSPRSLVYLPLRANPPVPGSGWDDHETPLDVVLAHRAVQFRASRWKRIRAVIRAGNTPRELRTAAVPERDLTVDGDIDWAVSGDRYVLRQHVHAETLVLSGAGGGFREAAREIFALAAQGPRVAARHRIYLPGGCNYHVCRCLYAWGDLRPDREQIHVEFQPRWAR